MSKREYVGKRAAFAIDDYAGYETYKYWGSPTTVVCGTVERDKPLCVNGCKYCDDEDMLHDIVCYLPTENGSSIDIPIIHCPACGRKVTGE